MDEKHNDAGPPLTATKDDPPVTVKYGARPECFSSTLQEVLFVLTATMAIGISSMFAGSVTVITSSVAHDLNMKTPEITWMSASSSLAGGSFLLFFARIADLFGRRALFVGSLFLFSVIAFGAGFSKSPLTLDILNGFVGLLSAAAVPPAQGMLGVIYDKPSKRKNAAFACFSAGNPLGFVFGMVSSGIASQLFGWRASYWWLAIIYIVFSAIACFIVPNDTSEKEKLSIQVLKRFDVLGTLLTIAGTGLFSAALSLGSDAPSGWRTGYVLALLIIGVLCIICFIFWELYVDHPLIPMAIFRDKNFSLLLSILLLGFAAFPTASFWISLYMQRVWKSSPLKTAVYLLPMAISGIAVNVLAALILHRVSNKLLMGIGAVAYTISFTLYSLNKTAYPYWAMVFPALILAVVGADFQFNVTNMYVMSSLSKSQQSIASGLFQTITRLCMTVGMGISTAIFDSVAKSPRSSGLHAHDPVEPYAAVFAFCAAFAGVSILLVPFLTIRTQGHRQKEADDPVEPLAVAVPRVAVESPEEKRCSMEDIKL